MLTYNFIPQNRLRNYDSFHFFARTGGTNPLASGLQPLPIAHPMAKLLLVEDNEMNRDMLSRRLARKGFEVICANDGGSGVELAAKELPDLILMDMSLPVLSGWDATAELKRTDATRAIPIIALTAHAMASDQERARAVGCDDYDTKPVDLQRLLGKIEALLGQGSGLPA